MDHIQILFLFVSVDNSVMVRRTDERTAMINGFVRENSSIANEIHNKVLGITEKNKSEGAKVGYLRYIKKNANQIWHFDEV